MTPRVTDGTSPLLPTQPDGDARRERDLREIRSAARQFEGLFMEQLIRQMRDAQLSEGFFGKGAGSSVYEGMFSQYMSEHLVADSPLGIAKLLEERWSARLDGAAESKQALGRVEAERAARTYAGAADAAAPAMAVAAPAAPVNEPIAAAASRSASRASAPRATATDPGISRRYGWGRDPIDGSRRFHHGVDLPARRGTPVLAVAPGRVASAETTPGYGLSVVIEHASGWETRYAHLSHAAVGTGQWIGRGQALGRVGSTGRSTGPHLHFEALHRGRHVDPAIAAPGDLRTQVFGPAADKGSARQR